MEVQESIKDKLRKLAALAERGMEGEAANAKRAIERICQQYGIRLEDMLEEDKKRYHIRVGRNPMQRQLFNQCYGVVVGTGEITYWNISRDTIAVELTPLQYAELVSMWEWHQSNFKRDLEDMEKTIVDAYISKHHLYAPSDGSEEDYELTAEEKARLLKAIYMSEALGDSRYQKMLESK
mgnify:FL=1|jgi:hypothetical protein